MENENHCDFVKLREMLIRTNMEDLRETTHLIHYELYRRHKLEEMGFSDSEMKRFVLFLFSFIPTYFVLFSQSLTHLFGIHAYWWLTLPFDIPVSSSQISY